MAADPVFHTVPGIAMAQLTVANANRDGTGTVVLLTSGVAGGRLIKKIEFKSVVTTTAGLIRLYVEQGGTYQLFKEIPVIAITVSGTVGGWKYTWIPSRDEEFVLPNGTDLEASIVNAEATNVIVHYRDPS